MQIPPQLQHILISDSGLSIFKKYFGFDSNEKHATPTSDSYTTTLTQTKTTYLKSRVSAQYHYPKVSSPLDFEAPYLESTFANLRAEGRKFYAQYFVFLGDFFCAFRKGTL